MTVERKFDEDAARATVASMADPSHQTNGSEDYFLELAMSDDLVNPELVTICASDVEPEKVEWLWQNRFPLGKVSTLAGDGGLGKSTVLIAMMGAVSRGRRWPNGEGQAPLGSSIYLSAEDGIADTIVPRLIAAGADRSKVHIVQAVKDNNKERWFNLESDVAALEAKAREIGDVVSIIIDPISSYLGRTDSHRNNEVRSVLEPLGQMAERLNAAVICNNHHSKSGGARAAQRIIGSIAFTAHSRAVTQVFEDEDEPGRFLFLPSKMNLGPKPIGLAYRLATTVLEGGIEVPCVAWDGTVSMTADEALRAFEGGAEGKSAIDEAMDFLRDELSQGSVDAKTMKSRATDAGITTKTLRTAREKLGVITEKEAFAGPWLWRMPEQPFTKVPNTHEDAQHALKEY